jgi:hypothetical protein
MTCRCTLQKKEIYIQLSKDETSLRPEFFVIQFSLINPSSLLLLLPYPGISGSKEHSGCTRTGVLPFVNVLVLTTVQ